MKRNYSTFLIHYTKNDKKLLKRSILKNSEVLKLSYIAEPPTAGSNLNHRFKVKKSREEFELVIQIRTGGSRFKFINLDY